MAIRKTSRFQNDEASSGVNFPGPAARFDDELQPLVPGDRACERQGPVIGIGCVKGVPKIQIKSAGRREFVFPGSAVIVRKEWGCGDA